jgi:CHAT domain-containing protein
VTKALGDIAFRRRRWDEAATSLRKAASIFAEGEEWSTSDRGVLAQLSELRDTYARLSYALHRSGRPAPECLEWLERGKTRLTVEHGRSFFEFGELAAAVPVQGAVVVPLVTSQGSLLWTITRKPDGTPLLATAELDNLTDTDFDGVLHGSDASPSWVRAYNAFLRSSDKAALQTWAATIDHVCHELWQLVGAEIEASLQTAGVAEGAPVAIAPPRQLAILPLHAAWRPNQDGTRHYLCDNYTITYTPSLHALTTATALRQARVSTAPSLLTIANPTGDLPHAAAEADSIAQYFPDGSRALLYGDAATKDQIITQASRHTYLHITCHGSFSSDNPSQSSLHLADGPARLDELRSLLPFEKFHLITLSACETGLLDHRRAPYEWLGIAGTLTRAGATDVICTLWSIDDMATAQLMNHFYRSLISERVPPAQALQRAQTAIRNEPHLRHPFYWAAFMHVGVPRQAE